MATTQSNTPAQTVNSIYDAFNRGDIPHILSLIAQDAPWRQPATLPWGGDYRGPQGAADFFQKLDSTMETIAFEPKENIEHGEEVFSFGTYSGRSRKTGQTGTAEWMFRWRVRDGKILAWNSYIDTAALLAVID